MAHFDDRLDAVLRDAARAGNWNAYKTWRFRHGWTEVAHPTCPSIPDDTPSWYFERSGAPNYYYPAVIPHRWQTFKALTAYASSQDENTQRFRDRTDALEDAFAAGITTDGLTVHADPDIPVFTDTTPEAHRDRLAAIDAATAALAETEAHLRAAAGKGGDRKALIGLRRWKARREAAIRRLCRPQP